MMAMMQTMMAAGGQANAAPAPQVIGGGLKPPSDVKAEAPEAQEAKQVESEGK